LADDFGTWVTAYAPLSAWGAGPAAGPRHVLGLDISAADWNRALWLEGVERAVIIWIVLGVPLGVWFVLRRHREQSEVIRNLSGAIEQAHSAIMIIDRGGRIEYGNRGLSRQLGYARREMIGRGWRDFVTGDDAAVVVGEIASSLEAGIAWEGGWSGARKDGTVIPVRGGFTPVKHRDGSTACFVAVFDDVTQEKRREAEMREAAELAQAGDRAKGQFLATMSHEVRTPLNGIVGFTSLLLDTPLSTEQREFVQTIRVSTEALIQLTGDILDFARIDSGKVKLDLAPCDPRECIEDALDLHATRAVEKGIELLHRIDPAVPASISADGGRLRQVLVNLIGNAVKFTDRGEVEVTVAPLQPPTAAEAEPLLLFTVRDTGIGIPEEHHSRLFRAFSQLDESTTRRHGGAGLGLAICRNLVGLMGGTISVSSQPGQGSTFSFTMRVVGALPAPPVPDLQGAKLAVIAAPGSLREEMAALLRSWRGEVTTLVPGAPAPAGGWPMVVMDISVERARRFGAAPPPAPDWDPDRAIGLVPISTGSDLRQALRRHFRLLVNKPVHHSSFFSHLVALQSRPTAPTAGPAAPAPPGPAATTAERSYGFRVLVVEDNVVNQRLIKRVLENLGCRPTLVGNGREAVDTLTTRAAEFDLVLLDMHMPVMDGLGALQAIRSGQAGAAARDIWIIALSADAREQQRAQAMAAGLNDYLTKPLDFGELDAVFRRFRETRERRAG
jgi:PAS domain S-box-containing protein